MGFNDPEHQNGERRQEIVEHAIKAGVLALATAIVTLMLEKPFPWEALFAVGSGYELILAIKALNKIE